MSAESTLPLSVTTPSSLSTSMLVMVLSPASDARAVLTLVVSAAPAALLLTVSRFFARSSALGRLCWRVGSLLLREHGEGNGGCDCNSDQCFHFSFSFG